MFGFNKNKQAHAHDMHMMIFAVNIYGFKINFNDFRNSLNNVP